MPSATYSYQQYQCPQEITDRLRDVGGVNRYDMNNFIIRWSQGGEDECYYRAGGAWDVEGLPSFKGYRDLLIGGGTPSWALLQWQDAVEYGTPESYYIQNYDESTGLQTLGEYPYQGRYRLLYNLRWSERIGNKIVFEAMPLNDFVIRTIVPIIMESKNISFEKYKAVMDDLSEREEKEKVAQIEDAMRDASVPFKGNIVSYGKQGCRTNLIDKRVESLLRYMNTISTRVGSLGGPSARGLMARDTVPE